jgi:hypothetical protein
MPVAAAIIGDALMAAVLAAFDMATKRCGTAAFNRRHDLELEQAQMPGLVSAVSGTFSAEDVGDLE